MLTEIRDLEIGTFLFHHNKNMGGVRGMVLISISVLPTRDQVLLFIKITLVVKSSETMFSPSL